jgi:hypothetical protein
MFSGTVRLELPQNTSINLSGSMKAGLLPKLKNSKTTSTYLEGKATGIRLLPVKDTTLLELKATEAELPEAL